MTATKLILSMLFLPLAALPSEAQRLAPVALRASDSPMTSVLPESSSPLAARRDTQPVARRTINPVGGVIGGVLGGVVGTFAGAFIGSATAEGCQGEDCGLLNVILGAGIGESIGVGLGAHVGSGSQRHENILLTSLTSAGILVGGTMLGVAMNNAGVVMLPLTPALQLAATLAIERY
jgi:hypothetical protein